MATKDEKNLAQVIDRIARLDEPERSLVQRVHEVIMAAAPDLDALDEPTEKRIAQIVRAAIA